MPDNDDELREGLRGWGGVHVSSSLPPELENFQPVIPMRLCCPTAPRYHAQSCPVRQPIVFATVTEAVDPEPLTVDPEQLWVIPDGGLPWSEPRDPWADWDGDQN